MQRARQLLVSIVLAVSATAAMPQAAADPPDTHEVLDQRPSGFWTSNRPATGGAYRWRLLAIGAVIAGVTGIFMVRLLRKASANRTSSVQQK